jgi:hypothetical protein
MRRFSSAERRVPRKRPPAEEGGEQDVAKIQSSKIHSRMIHTVLPLCERFGFGEKGAVVGDDVDNETHKNMIHQRRAWYVVDSVIVDLG